MTATITSRFGHIVTDADALEVLADNTRAFLARPLPSHKNRRGQLWERLAERADNAEAEV